LHRNGGELVLGIMEQWRRELDSALQQGLEESDDEFELELERDLFDPMAEETSSSPKRPKIGGTKAGRRYVHRDREACNERLHREYFAKDSTFDALKFRCRFRMRRELFLYIVQEVCAFDLWFVQKYDGVGRLGLASLQKCTTAMRMLAYGIPADAIDAIDEYYRTGKSTAIEAMKRFTVAIRGCFESRFLRLPTREDFQRQLDINAARGFPEMFGSLDCMRWA
jgi:hypothetical protein